MSSIYDQSKEIVKQIYEGLDYKFTLNGVAMTISAKEQPPTPEHIIEEMDIPEEQKEHIRKPFKLLVVKASHKEYGSITEDTIVRGIISLALLNEVS